MIMWQLFKSLSEYSKFILIASMSVVTMVSAVFVFIGGRDLDHSIPAYRSTLFAATAVVWLYSILNLHKEKRDRFHTLLPISVKQIGMVRVFFLITFWMALLVMFFLSNLIIGNTQSFSILFWDVMSLTGFVLMVNAAPFLHRDLTHIFLKKFHRFLLMIVYVILVILGYILFIVFIIPLENYSALGDVVVFIQETVLSPGGGCIFLFVGLTMTYLSIMLFSRRELYTE